MSARDAVLAAVRAATAGSAAVPPSAIARGYRREWAADEAARLERLSGRLADYGVMVLRVAHEDEVAETARRRLEARAITSVVVPPDLPVGWRPGPPGVREDRGETVRELDGIGGVMTGCALAIAETGSLVLDAGAAQGRRILTLLPDYHLCVVLARQVVGIVPEAIARLRPSIDAARPVTFISGPSATADIELERVQGVHGPRILEVILVGGTDGG